MSSDCFSFELNQKVHQLSTTEKCLVIFQYFAYFLSSVALATVSGYYLFRIETNNICISNNVNVSSQF